MRLLTSVAEDSTYTIVTRESDRGRVRICFLSVKRPALRVLTQ